MIEFLGNTGRYLQLPAGDAQFNLRLMLRAGIQHPIMEAVREVLTGAPDRRRDGLVFRHESGLSRVNVHIERLVGHPLKDAVLRILFEEAPRQGQDPAGKRIRMPLDPVTPLVLAAHAVTARKGGKDVRVERLKQDLVATRSTLESIIEEQEIGTARLKSAYYQLESANAEMEATNQELAAANIELEALNEQLATTIQERDEAESERERIEAELVQSQRLESLRVMAGGVAHDFNNLLTSILGNAGLLSEGLPRNSELWDAAEQIEKAGQHATGLVRQMLAFCGKASFSPERLDLSTLVSESVELLRASISKTAELRCDLAEGLPAIDADVTQLRQVLINLVVNASEAIGNSAGIIRVITGRADVRPGDNGTVLNGPPRPGCYVSLKISDTGRGMTDDTKGRVFEPFFSTKFSGRGLGLAAVEGIVRSHHGAIRLHSRPGQGTVMEILFPALEGAAASQQTAEMDSDAGWHAQGRVLVVDDEESVRNVAKAILKRAGLEVITAAGGREALSILHRNGTNGRKIGAVLLDLVMPQVSGQEVLRQLRAFSPELPVILSSGYNDEHELAAQLTSFGPTIFLAKPYRPAELLEKVRGALNLQPKAAQPAAATNGRK